MAQPVAQVVPVRARGDRHEVRDLLEIRERPGRDPAGKLEQALAQGREPLGDLGQARPLRLARAALRPRSEGRQLLDPPAQQREARRAGVGVEGEVDRHQHGRERNPGVVPAPHESEVARRQRVVPAAPGAQRGLDRLDVADQGLVPGRAAARHTATKSNCSWCSSGSACRATSPPTSDARPLSTEASSPPSARAISGLTRSTSRWPRMSAASLRTSS